MTITVKSLRLLLPRLIPLHPIPTLWEPRAAERGKGEGKTGGSMKSDLALALTTSLQPQAMPGIGLKAVVRGERALTL